MGKKSFLVPFFLALCPIILIFYFLVLFRFEVPFRDSWFLVPFLDKFFHGTLSISDLISQHCEHRPFFPRIIMLGLARLTGWNFLYESLVNVLCAGVVFVAFVWLLRKTLLESGVRKVSHWTIPLIALFIFSFSQHENFWAGWQIVFMLTMVCVVLGITLLSSGKLTWLKVFVASSCGIIATFSHAIGLVFWLIGLFIIGIVPSANKREKAAFFCFWAIIAGLVLLLYFWGFQRTVYVQYPITKRLAIFSSPVEYGKFFFKYLSSGVAYFSTKVAYCLSLFGLGILIVYTRHLMPKSRFDVKPFLPYLSFCFFAVGAALLTGLNRAGWCSIMAFSSRYSTVSLLFWVSLWSMLYCTCMMLQGRRRIAVAVKIALIFLTCSLCLSSVFGFFEWKSQSIILKSIETDLRRQSPADAYMLWADGGAWGTSKDIEFLQANHLALFRHSARKE